MNQKSPYLQLTYLFKSLYSKFDKFKSLCLLSVFLSEAKTSLQFECEAALKCWNPLLVAGGFLSAFPDVF